jgi:hypothetical protein
MTTKQKANEKKDQIEPGSWQWFAFFGFFILFLLFTLYWNNHLYYQLKAHPEELDAGAILKCDSGIGNICITFDVDGVGWNCTQFPIGDWCEGYQTQPAIRGN